MSHLLIIGASRGIGRETVRQALAAGHRVRAMARDPSRIDGDEALLERFAGDATDPAAVETALAGVDAVIQTLGIGLGLRTMAGPVDLFSRATDLLVPLMESKGPRRLLAVTGIGAGDSREALSSLENLAKDLVMGPIYRDKSRQETRIRNSALDWTIVRPTLLTWGAKTGRYRVMTDPATWRKGMISRADVAHFLVTEVAAGAFIGKAPILAY
jgi:putative NADH-flavin reductase